MSTDNQWAAKQAVYEIRAIAASRKLTISYTRHALEQMQDRGLTIPDVLFALKNGFVHEEPSSSTRTGFFKYCVECLAINGSRRTVRVVTIPDKSAVFLKIVTVMWVDENSTVSGNIIGVSDE
jgi:Domain of unknown function (DUF4258)